MDFNLDSTDKVISIGAASFGIVVFVLKKIIIPKFKKMKNHFTNIREMMGKVSYIYTELTPNGGGSIKDKIDKIRLDMSEIYDLSVANGLKVHLLFAESKEALFEANLKGNVIWTNQAMQEMWGLSAGEMLGDSALSCVHPSDSAEIWNLWIDAVKTQRPYRARYRLINAETNQQVWVECIATLLRDSKSRPLSFWGKVVEISNPNMV